jgi:hypothetical protein
LKKPILFHFFTFVAIAKGEQYVYKDSLPTG